MAGATQLIYRTYRNANLSFLYRTSGKRRIFIKFLLRTRRAEKDGKRRSFTKINHKTEKVGKSRLL